MRPYTIKRSLYRPVVWMGMERTPGAVWILCMGVFGLMGFMYAKAYFSTLILVLIGVCGTIGLRKLAEYDGLFFQVIFRRANYQDIYPAYTRNGNAKGRR